MTQMFKKPPSPRNWKVWIGIALIIRGAMFGYSLVALGDTLPSPDYPDFTIGTSGDLDSYLSGIDNFLENGEYDRDYRMPGYGVVYMVLKLIFGKWAYNALTISQYLLSCIAVYYLCLCAILLFKSKRLFYYTYLLAIIGSCGVAANARILTESYTISAFIFLFYFLLCFFDQGKVKFLWYCASLFCWIVFMRPVYLPLCLVFIFPIFLHYRKKSWKDVLKYATIFMLPFLFFDSIWTTRNYLKNQNFRPLHNGRLLHNGNYDCYVTETPLKDVVRITQAIGGGEIYYEYSEYCFFFPKPCRNTKDYELPKYAQTAKYNKDSLLSIAKNVQAFYNENSQEAKLKYLAKVEQQVDGYINDFKEEKPFRYYIISPLKLLWMTITWNDEAYDTYVPFWKMLLFRYPYYFTLILSLVGIILLMHSFFRNGMVATLTMLSVYGLLINSLILRSSQNRYIEPSYPFIVYLRHMLCID